MVIWRWYKKLLGKDKASKALLITTASVPYGHDPKPAWLVESLGDVAKLTDSYDETTLESDAYFPKDLSEYDYIFVTGGNSFYLAYRLAETGMDEMLKEYINSGGVYSGSSAGSVILMNDIEHFSLADDPSKAPNVCKGLGVIDFAIIPHANSEKYGDVMIEITEKYKKDGVDTKAVNDDQVLVVDGNTEEII